jgi:hypothetical protein
MEGIFLFVVLDRPDVQSVKGSLRVNATSMLPGKNLSDAAAGLIEDEGNEGSVSGQSVVGNFAGSQFCTDGFAASGFQDTDGKLDVGITFKHQTSKTPPSFIKIKVTTRASYSAVGSSGFEFRWRRYIYSSIQRRNHHSLEAAPPSFVGRQRLDDTNKRSSAKA